MSKLSDIAEIEMGISPEGSTCNESGIGLPLLNGPTEFGTHHPTPVQFSTGYRKKSRTNDLLFCVRGSTTGRMNWSDREYAIGRGICAIRHKAGIGYHGYLRGVIEFSLDGLLAQATGSTFPNVSRDQLRDIEVESCPLTTQLAISRILTNLDDKIELLRQMNETLEAIARALFKSWFVDFDSVRKKADVLPTGLPKGIEDLFPSEFEDSELGEIPKGWRSQSLDTMARFLNGLPGQKFPAAGAIDDVPVIKIAEVRAGSVDGCDWANPSFPPEYMVENGDILFPWSGSLMVKLWSSGRGLLNQHIFKVLPQGHSSWYCYLWLKYYLPDFQSIAQDKATTMGHIQRGHISERLCLVPPPVLESWMNSQVEPIFESLRANLLELATLAETRDKLLPKLISGEIDLTGGMILEILGVQDGKQG